MKATVLIPWRGGCEHRERALKWVLARFAAEHPSWPVEVVEAPAGAWCKAKAVNPAVCASERSGVVVIADADTWCDGLAAGVEALERGSRWAVPHQRVYRLSESATAGVLGGDALDLKLDLTQPPYQGVAGGGYVIAHRETLVEIPMPQFEGWGQEDASWALALHTLAGRCWRGGAPLYHLFHPPQERATRVRGSADGWARYRRFRVARNDPEAMRALIEESREPDHADQHALHACPQRILG